MTHWYHRFWNNGHVLLITAAFFFSSMSAFVKAAGPQIPLFEIVFFRSFISAVILALLLWFRRIPFRPQNFPLIMSRSLAGFLAVCCNFFALTHLALGDAAMLILTFPIFIALLSFLFLGERPTGKLISFIILAWVGILIILRPQIQILNFAGFIALLGAIFSALDIITVHLLHRSEHVFRIAFFHVAVSSFISLPLMLQNYVRPNLDELLLLLGAGISGTLAQIIMAQAYGLDDVSRLSPLSYVSVVFSFLLGVMFWSEIPTGYSLLGSSVVIIACIQIARLRKTEPVLE